MCLSGWTPIRQCMKSIVKKHKGQWTSSGYNGSVKNRRVMHLCQNICVCIHVYKWWVLFGYSELGLETVSEPDIYYTNVTYFQHGLSYSKPFIYCTVSNHIPYLECQQNTIISSLVITTGCI